jgi:cytochrome c oxidase subunit 2
VKRLLPLLALAGCRGPQAPLDAWGPQAERIADLSWVLFFGGGVILTLVVVLTTVAVWAPPAIRRRVGTLRFVVGMGLVFPTVTLTALLFYSLGTSRALALFGGGEEPLRIEVIGRQYWWEMRYEGSGAVTANELRLPRGREVELKLTSADVIHSLWIPNLHGKLDMIPGRANILRLRADRTGKLRGQCTEFCGRQHTLMAFSVVIHEPPEFEAWLARQMEPVPPPATEEEAEGMRVFGAAGCGACHAVRGTEWQGRLAPDLSRMGSRLTLAAGALPNTRGNLAGWIAAPQDIKPGNFMPAYARSLSGEEILALSAWLDSLR